MKGWVGLVGWPIADGLPTLVVTHQLQVERRTGKVRRPETDVLPLCYATNYRTWWLFFKIVKISELWIRRRIQLTLPYRLSDSRSLVSEVPCTMCDCVAGYFFVNGHDGYRSNEAGELLQRAIDMCQRGAAGSHPPPAATRPPVNRRQTPSAEDRARSQICYN